MISILPRAIWLWTAEKTTGIFSFEGRGDALDQFPQHSSFIYFYYKKDTIWIKGPPGLGLKEDSPVVVLFQPDDPTDAKIDKFSAIWLKVAAISFFPFFVIVVCFIHPHIVPWRSKILLIPRKPFIKIIDKSNASNSYVDLPHSDNR